MLSFYNITKNELMYQYHTRKPVTCLRFFRNHEEKQDNCWLLYGEFKDIVLFDWRSQQVARRWALHRNVVLQLDFVPPLKAKFTRNHLMSRHIGISLAFDHSIKLWELSELAEQPPLLDKIHSSTNQPFTAFCFRKPADSDVWMNARRVILASPHPLPPFTHLCDPSRILNWLWRKIRESSRSSRFAAKGHCTWCTTSPWTR